jgi:hypothetical protein
MINRTCLDCKHIVEDGEKDYYCNFKELFFVGAESEDLQDHAEDCIGFEDNDTAIADQLLELRQEFPTLEQLSKNEVAA